MCILCEVAGEFSQFLLKPLETKHNSYKEFQGKTREEFIDDCASGKFNQVVAIFRSNESTALTGSFDKDLISHLPVSVKYICHNGEF